SAFRFCTLFRPPPTSPLFPYTTLFRSLYAWGFREVLLIVVMRQLVGSLVTGTLSAPAFVIGLTGGVVSVAVMALVLRLAGALGPDRKSTRMNSSHVKISYAVFCLQKKN